MVIIALIGQTIHMPYSRRPFIYIGIIDVALYCVVERILWEGLNWIYLA